MKKKKSTTTQSIKLCYIRAMIFHTSLKNVVRSSFIPSSYECIQSSEYSNNNKQKNAPAHSSTGHWGHGLGNHLETAAICLSQRKKNTEDLHLCV